MYLLSEEYFYKDIVKYNKETVTQTMVFRQMAYHKFYLPKLDGTKREILGIDSNSMLYKMQKNILDNFLSKIELPICANGFVKNTSYISYLYKHVNKNYYLRMDIKDFFRFDFS